MTDSPLQKVLNALYAVTGYEPRRSGKGWIGKCPAHNDENPSLSIHEGDDGRILLKCHAGCSNERVVERMRLAMRDLFPQNGRPRASKRKRKIVKVYPYLDEHGVLLCEAVRFVPKAFAQRRPDGKGGYVWNMDEVRRVLYRLPQIIAAGVESFIFAAEGEKDADRLTAEGLVATTSSCGAGKAHLTDWSHVYGRHVVIVLDNDPDGHKHAQEVARLLHGKAASVRIVVLPGLSDKGDVSDWLDGGGDAEELVRLAEASPLWTPESQLGDDGIGGAVGPVTVCLADVKPETIRWLWPLRVPLGKLTLIAGDPGLGKSLITIDIAARTSSGIGWPDIRGERFEPGGVVILNAEDDLADTIRPRLDAAGADVSRISALRAVQHYDPETGNASEAPFCLTTDLPALETAIQRCADCRLVIVDPVSAYLGRTDSHSNAEVRGLLAPLSDLAARHGVAVVAVTHLRKGEGPAVYRAMGSLAFMAAPRAVWAVSKDSDDPEKRRRFMLPVKVNIAADVQGLAYRVISADSADSPVIAWEAEPVTLSADDALSSERSRSEGQTALDEAIDWLRNVLREGQVKARDVKERAEDDGIAPRTLDRAKAKLCVVAAPDGYRGPWVWRLPGSQEEPHNAPTAPECAIPDTRAHCEESGALWRNRDADEATGNADEPPSSPSGEEQQ